MGVGGAVMDNFTNTLCLVIAHKHLIPKAVFCLTYPVSFLNTELPNRHVGCSISKSHLIHPQVNLLHSPTKSVLLPVFATLAMA